LPFRVSDSRFCEVAGHLLSRREDSEYAAEIIGPWASRYVLDARPAAAPRPTVADGDVLVREVGGKFTQEVLTGRHSLVADEPQSYGGDDAGPSPYEYLAAGHGACTAMTVRVYAERRKLPLERVSVPLRYEKIHAEDCAGCETTEGRIDRIERELLLEGELSDEQKA